MGPGMRPDFETVLVNLLPLGRGQFQPPGNDEKGRRHAPLFHLLVDEPVAIVAVVPAKLDGFIRQQDAVLQIVVNLADRDGVKPGLLDPIQEF